MTNSLYMTGVRTFSPIPESPADVVARIGLNRVPDEYELAAAAKGDLLPELGARDQLAVEVRADVFKNAILQLAERLEQVSRHGAELRERADRSAAAVREALADLQWPAAP